MALWIYAASPAGRSGEADGAPRGGTRTFAALRTALVLRGKRRCVFTSRRPAWAVARSLRDLHGSDSTESGARDPRGRLRPDTGNFPQPPLKATPRLEDASCVPSCLAVVPGPVALWIALGLGHLAATAAPIPALLEAPARSLALGLGALSLALGALAGGTRGVARPTGWRRFLDRAEPALGWAALLLSGAALAGEADPRLGAPGASGGRGRRRGGKVLDDGDRRVARVGPVSVRRVTAWGGGIDLPRGGDPSMARRRHSAALDASRPLAAVLGTVPSAGGRAKSRRRRARTMARAVRDRRGDRRRSALDLGAARSAGTGRVVRRLAPRSPGARAERVPLTARRRARAGDSPRRSLRHRSRGGAVVPGGRNDPHPFDLGASRLHRRGISRGGRGDVPPSRRDGGRARAPRALGVRRARRRARLRRAIGNPLDGAPERPPPGPVGAAIHRVGSRGSASSSPRSGIGLGSWISALVSRGSGLGGHGFAFQAAVGLASGAARSARPDRAMVRRRLVALRTERGRHGGHDRASGAPLRRRSVRGAGAEPRRDPALHPLHGRGHPVPRGRGHLPGRPRRGGAGAVEASGLLLLTPERAWRHSPRPGSCPGSPRSSP